MTVIVPPSEPERARASEAVRALVADFSIEATPKQVAAAPDLAAMLPVGCSVYVPFLSGADIADSAVTCAELAAAGLRPVPHLPARALASRARLDDWLVRLAVAGADSVLLIAGDLETPNGPFADTLAILDSGALERHGFRRVGVAGHPEGHPFAGPDELDRALRHKAAYAAATDTEMWLVTQFVFAADPVRRWLDRLDAAGIDLPVRIGLPGPTRMRTLVSFALQCGVGASARMLQRRQDLAKLLVKRWNPDELLAALAARCGGRIAGVHVFPFGGLRRSAEWFAALRGIDLPAAAATHLTDHHETRAEA